MQLPYILQQVKSLGYTVFETDHSPYNLNIIGVRNPDQIANSFNDTLYVLWKYLGAWYQYSYPITTDPGLYYLNNPMRVDGTAILAPGQYRNAYELGTHSGYQALVQTGPVRVFRDNNKNEIIDWHGPTHEGYYGINIHRASPTATSTNVNKWSAGCQVFASPRHFNEFMAWTNSAVNIWGPKFTYTLIKE